MATTSKALEDLENKLGLAVHEREMAQHGKAKALQDLKHTTNRCNKLRSEAKRLQGRADSVCKRVKHWQNRHRELKRSRFLWKQKYKPLLKKNFNRALAKIERPSIRRGRYFPARVRQMYYSLLNCRVSEKQANRVVLAVANGLGLTINPKSLPNRRTLGRFRLESGAWAQICAARRAAASKAQNPEDFSISSGRDGTSKNGWQVQAQTIHCPNVDGKRIKAVIAAPLTHNKTAVTQAHLSTNAMAFLIGLSGSALSVADFESSVSDSANNEKKTNRLEGRNIQVPCLAHIGHNTAKHGVLPTARSASVSCKCDQYDPPNSQGPTKWVICSGCAMWCHQVCYSLTDPIPSSFLCQKCTTEEVTPWDHAWSWHLDMQRQVVKALTAADYGKGAAADFRNYLADKDENPIIMGRDVGARFFGGFFCSVQILSMRDHSIGVLEGKVQAQSPPPKDAQLPREVGDAVLLEDVGDPQAVEQAGDVPTGTKEKPKPGGWWKSLLEWLRSREGLLFLLCGCVLHACWGKPFFKDILSQDLSVADALPIVREYTTRLKEWATDPHKALEWEGRGMEIVCTYTATNCLYARLRTIFSQMHARWDFYCKEYRPGGGLDVARSPHVRALKNTPCTTVFEESFFGTLTDTMKLMGVRASPWQAIATAISRQNNSILLPLLENDVPQVMALAKETQDRHPNQLSIRQELNRRKQDDLDRAAEEKAAKAAKKQQDKDAKAAKKQQDKEDKERRKAEGKPVRNKRTHADAFRGEAFQEGCIGLPQGTSRGGRQIVTPLRFL